MYKSPKKLSSFFAAPLFKTAAFLTCLALSQPAFAQADRAFAKMNTLAENIANVFRQPFVRIILGIAFSGAGLAYAVNKDNDKVKRSCIAIAIASALIIAGSYIAEWLLSDA